MFHVWCAISGHGYGHAAQVLPVLKALHQLVPPFRVTIRSTVPSSFFQHRLSLPYSYSHAKQDIGCIQQGPLHIDVVQTWEEHYRFHAEWNERLESECKALASSAPHVILSDISYLAIAAGHQLGIPTVALATLTWDKVLAKLSDSANLEQARLMRDMTDAYLKADMILHPYPSLRFDGHKQVRHIGTIHEKVGEARATVQGTIGAQANERIILIGFGGVPLDSIPFHRIEGLTGFRFIVSGPVPEHITRVTSSSRIPLPFNVILASCDLVMTKPGYSTIADCVGMGKPVVYVRRYNFADEEGLVHYLHQYGRGIELSMQDFLSGQWEDALNHALRLPPSNLPVPQPTGAQEAAAILAEFA